jgi:hypothetical protein
MNCFRCNKRSKYIFCNDHIPKYGDIVINLTEALFVGSIPISQVIKYKVFFKKRIIKWWMGTDALEMRMTPPGKSRIKRLLHVIKMNLLELAIDEHWVVNECLKNDYKKLANAKIVIHSPEIKKAKKIFIVAYYFPQDTKFNRWKYGYDIVEQLKEAFPNIIFLQLFRTIPESVWKVIDCYIRPSRHDGTPRINLRCEIENIPYKYSSDFKPKFNEFREWINEQYKSKTKSKF